MFEIVIVVLTVLFLVWIFFTKLINKPSNKSRAEMVHECDYSKDSDS